MKFIVLLAFVLGCSWLGFNLTCSIAATIFFLLALFAFLGALITAVTNLWEALNEEIKERRRDKFWAAVEGSLYALFIWFFLLRFFF